MKIVEIVDNISSGRTWGFSITNSMRSRFKAPPAELCDVYK